MQYNTQLANDAALQEAVSRLVQVKAEIGKVIVGQDDVVEGGADLYDRLRPRAPRRRARAG